MSYILDALRKAESERERGTVPGIHAQPVRQASVEATPRTGLPAWVWAVVGLCVLLAGVLVWQMTGGRSDAAAPAGYAATPSVVATAPKSAAVPVPATEKNSAAEVSPPASGSTTATTSAPASSTAATSKGPSVPAIAAVLKEAAPAVRKPALVASAAGTLPTAPAATAVALATTPGTATPQAAPPVTAQKLPMPIAPTAPGAQPIEPRVYALNELPDDIRRQLPALSVSGSMYSAVPANRLVIFNGQVFHEGDKVTTDLVLEQIKPKAAVLRYKTYRYSLSY
ncbi:hypothetical protein BH11PSE8_BH11PSE8_44340 [soil metagenome]